jgi:hypothetical protein
MEGIDNSHAKKKLGKLQMPIFMLG